MEQININNIIVEPPIQQDEILYCKIKYLDQDKLTLRFQNMQCLFNNKNNLIFKPQSSEDMQLIHKLEKKFKIYCITIYRLGFQTRLNTTIWI